MVCPAFTAPVRLALHERDVPVPKSAELLVEVATAGLGYVDALICEGRYQVRPTIPFVPGVEIAGRVVAVGSGVTAFTVGDRVAGLAESGALAEYAIVREALAVSLPANISTVVAAASLTNYCTALYGLADLGDARSGETVLVLGAGGGVGMAAIDVARWLGLRPIAAASSRAKRDAAATQGAAGMVDYLLPDWRAALETEIGKGAIGLVFDTVGGPFSEPAFRTLAPGGRHLVVGFASGDIARLPLNLPLLKRSSLVGVDWGGALRADHTLFRPMFTRVLDGLAGGALQPMLQECVPLADAGKALAQLGARRWQGKLVVDVVRESIDVLG